MKTLYIMRHAKSSWAEIGSSDFDRSITKDGEQDSMQILTKLKQMYKKPELIISSDAIRAKQTASLVLKILSEHGEIPVEYNNSIYRHSSDAIEKALYSISNEINTVMIIGHNPYLSNFIDEVNNSYNEMLKTSEITIIDFHADKWDEIFSSKNRIVDKIKKI